MICSLGVCVACVGLLLSCGLLVGGWVCVLFVICLSVGIVSLLFCMFGVCLVLFGLWFVFMFVWFAFAYCCLDCCFCYVGSFVVLVVGTYSDCLLFDTVVCGYLVCVGSFCRFCVYVLRLFIATCYALLCFRMLCGCFVVGCCCVLLFVIIVVYVCCACVECLVILSLLLFDLCCVYDCLRLRCASVSVLSLFSWLCGVCVVLVFVLLMFVVWLFLYLGYCLFACDCLWC